MQTPLSAFSRMAGHGFHLEMLGNEIHNHNYISVHKISFRREKTTENSKYMEFL